MQTLQLMMSGRQIGLESILYNFAGATVGAYGVILTIYLLKGIFLLINNLSKYKSGYSEDLESITDVNDIHKKPNFIMKYMKYLLRYCHLTGLSHLKITLK